MAMAARSSGHVSSAGSRLREKSGRVTQLHRRRSLYDRLRLGFESLELRRLLATDLVTSNLDDGSAGTLRSVIASAAAGDTIDFQSGISQIDLTQGQIEISKNLSINGPGASQLTINQTSAGAALFQIDAADASSNTVTVSILGVSLGGGIIDNGSLTYSNNGDLTISSGISGSGALTVTATGNMDVTSANIAVGNGLTLYAAGYLTVHTGVTLNSYASNLTLGADVNADGAGNVANSNNTNANTLTIGDNSTPPSDATKLYGASITLRGAQESIGTNATVGSSGPTTTTFATNELNNISGLAVDAQGNLYAADSGNNTISEVDPNSGKVSLLVPASIGLNNPAAIAFDDSGNLYIANENAKSISEVSAAAIQTFLTSGTPVSAGDVTTFGSTYLSQPDALAFDATTRHLDVANLGNNSISVVDPASGNLVSTITNSLIDVPVALAVDRWGDLYVANDNNIQDARGNVIYNNIAKVAPDGTVSTFVPFEKIYDAEGNPHPAGLTVDAAGNLYLSNALSSGIMKIAPDGAATNYDDGVVATAGPLAIDSSNHLYVANGSAISKVAPPVTSASGNVSTLTPASVITPSYVMHGGIAVDASGTVYWSNGHDIQDNAHASHYTFPTSGLAGPEGLALDANGNLYVANFGNNTVAELNTASGAIIATITGFNEPEALAFDSGYLYVANYGSGTVSKVDLSGPTPVVTNYVPNTTFKLVFGDPSALAFDCSHNLYVATTDDGVDKVTPPPSQSVTHFTNVTGGIAIDSSGRFYVADPDSNFWTVSASGVPTAPNDVNFASPEGLALDGQGNLYVTSWDNNGLISEIPWSRTPTALGAVTTFATDTDRANAQPEGMAADSNKNLYVANFADGTVSEIPTTGPSPSVPSIVASNLDQPSGLAVAGDGTIYVGSFDGEIYKGPAGNVAPWINLASMGYSHVAALALDSAGNLYASCTGLNGEGVYILKIDSSGNFTLPPNLGGDQVTGMAFDKADNLWTTVAGIFGAGFMSQSGFITGVHGGLDFPYGVVIGPDGNAYVANKGDGTITRITPSIHTSTIASGLIDPEGVAFVGNTLYVLNGGNNTISKVTLPASGPVTSFVAGFNNPQSLAFDTSGNMYVGNNDGSITKVTPAGNASTFLGSGYPGPLSMALDGSGNLYVLSSDSSTIKKVTPSGLDSNLVISGLYNPKTIVYHDGDFYVADTNDDRIVQVTTSGIVSTYPVSGLSGPTGLAFDAAGNLYIDNTGSASILKVTPSGVMSPFATGIYVPFRYGGDMAFDGAGNLWIADNSVSGFYKVTPTGTVSTVSGYATNFGLAFDSAGNLYFPDGGSIIEVHQPLTPTTQITIQSSVETRPMVIGDRTGTAANGINLGNNELKTLVVGANGNVTFGDSGQKGNITFANATVPGINSGASLTALQSTSDGGAIILVNGSPTPPAISIGANVGRVTLTPGTGGIVNVSAGQQQTVDIWTGAAGDGAWSTAGNWDNGVPTSTSHVVIAGKVTVTHSSGTDNVNTLTVGPSATLNITGTSSIVAMSSSASPQVIDDGAINYNSSTDVTIADSIGGSGTLAITSTGTFDQTVATNVDRLSANAATINVSANMSCADGITLYATGDITVGSNMTLNSYASALTLGADEDANNTGTLSIDAGAKIYGGSITLRGAQETIDPSATVGSSGPTTTTFASASTGLDGAGAMAFDQNGNLYVGATISFLRSPRRATFRHTSAAG